ncbi:S-adenosyl-L-methionine-dependent methyltransferase [Thermoascus aurantiacus ATCC 26904]
MYTSSTYTASLTSSVLGYRKENGRTYHGFRDGSYLMPNDEIELDRLDMIHEMMLTLMDRKLFFAPIGPSPQRVYDVATGTGIWAIQFAEEFPSAEVIGSDLSPSQPNMIPPNVKFIVDDIEDEWLYENDSFDFIHARFLVFSIRDFPKLIKQAYKCTKPGGWVEFQDWDPICRSEDGTTIGTAIEDYFKLMIEGYGNQGYETCPGPKLEQWLRDAGFQDIKAKKLRIPMGTWPKDKKFKALGAWNLMQAETGFEAGAMALLTRFHGWSADEVRIFTARTLKDARDRNIHPLFHFWVVYGRKPESASA